MVIACHSGARILGGQERAVVRLLAALCDRGHYVILLCNSDNVIEHALDHGVPARRCVIGGDLALHNALTVARELYRLDPDVFIVSTWKKLFLASLAARIARVPRVVTRIGLETQSPSNPKYRYALKHWVHGVAVNGQRMLAPFASLSGFSGDVVLIHNGVEPSAPTRSREEMRDELGVPRDAFVVGCIARLDRTKRLDRVIAVMASLPAGIHCVIAGSGHEAKALARQSEENGTAARIHFAGHRDDVWNVLEALDVYVVASDREGHSNSMLEALSAGVPVVSTDVSGATDSLLDDGDDAGVVTDFSVDSITQAVRALYENEERRAQMGRAARRLAAERFSMEAMLDKWESFLGAN